MDDPTLGPPRLVEDQGASPLGRAVLSSAAGDGPDTNRRAAAARRLGIAATTLLAGGEVSGAAVTGALAWWKLGLVVTLIGGAVAVGILQWPDASEPALPAPQLTSASESTVEPALPARTQVVRDEASAPATTEPAAIVEPATPPVVTRPPARKPRHVEPPVETTTPAPPTETPVTPPPAPVQIDTRRLAAEVAVLDRARAALRAGDAAAALAALDEHDREFADGALVAEAEVVRIETLIQNRQSVAARERAASFLSRFPQSPLARRVRSLLDRLKETP